jgi:crotonobetainyl-CoA:carnitine CoA-transferase CaiB-like acyl-CoA transferase
MPLKGLRVIELGSLPAASYCARLFADFGAEVIKIEAPSGDPGRLVGPLLSPAEGTRESGYFGFLNFNKGSVVINAANDADIRRLRELVASADVMIDSLDTNSRAALDIDHRTLGELNDALIVADISWFGNQGPYRDFKATDSVCRALAGLAQLIGPKEGPPIPLEDYQGVPVGGLTTFIALMAALQDTAGPRGRAFEISLHEANIAIADYNVALAWANGAPDKRWGVNRFAPNFPLGIYRCKSGWIGVTVVTPVQWKTFCNLLNIPDLGRDPAYAINRGRLAAADIIEARFAPQFMQRTADEWFALALEHRLPFVVVPSMEQLLANAEHRRRGSFVSLQHGRRTYEVPRSPLRLTATPPKAGGSVPALGGNAPQWSDDTRYAKAWGKATSARLPLAGLRVVDLSMGWAGPHATRHFADLGCDVIKVEACQYPDWWRGVDNRPIVIEQMLYEKSSYFNVLNRNKRGITLDLTTPEGVDLVKELVRGADAVIENYSNGVLPKLGLDYASLRKINPGIVMVSMPAFAADGEWSECRAYGSTLEQASGLPSVSGHPNGPPAMNHIAHGDPIGGLNAAAALLVAILHKRRTGEGQHIDISQVECMLPLVAPWLIEQSIHGAVAPRRGGGHPSCVPHGCFPCRGDDAWILIAVEDESQWQALCDVIERVDLSKDAALATTAGRRQREDAIKEAISAWTGRRTADVAMTALQQAGVAAGVARRPLDLLDDPHLHARGFWQWVDRPFVGSHPQPSPAYRETCLPVRVRRPAPTLGEHNIPVLRDVLGLSQTEIDRLSATTVIGTKAVPPNLRKARAAVG